MLGRHYFLIQYWFKLVQNQYVPENQRCSQAHKNVLQTILDLRLMSQLFEITEVREVTLVGHALPDKVCSV